MKLILVGGAEQAGTQVAEPGLTVALSEAEVWISFKYGRQTMGWAFHANREVKERRTEAQTNKGLAKETTKHHKKMSESWESRL